MEEDANTGAAAGEGAQPREETSATTQAEATPTPEKTFTQNDIDAAVNAAKADWEKEQNQAARLAKMTKEQREQEQLRLDREKLDNDIAAFQRNQLIAETANQLMERGLPKNFAEHLCGKDADETKTNIEAFEKDFNTAVQTAVKEQLKGTPPKVVPVPETETDPFLAGFKI